METDQLQNSTFFIIEFFLVDQPDEEAKKQKKEKILSLGKTKTILKHKGRKVRDQINALYEKRKQFSK